MKQRLGLQTSTCSPCPAWRDRMWASSH